jgi:aspartyl-tRNA(Asn)/glutamyl-tRNA(Gln) amidotransferase subunit C
MTPDTATNTTIITIEQVKKVAHLARLNINENDIKKQVANLSNILSMIDQINATDTGHVAPMSSSLEGANIPLRADKIVDENQRDILQKLAPAVDSGLYLVPQVIE